MSDELDFSEGIPTHLDKAIRAQANRVARIGRGMVEYDDLISEVYVAMVKHPARYKDYWIEGEQTRQTMNVFSTMVYRIMLRWLNTERAARTGGSKDDAFYYHSSVIEELLPDVFNVEDRMFAVTNDADEGVKRHRSMPNEGNGRAAMLVDVRRAVDSLRPDEQWFLRLRFMGPGKPHSYTAREFDISESASRSMLHRIITKMSDFLGGDPS